MDKIKIIKALASVIDPDTGKDLVSLSLIKDLKVEGNNVSFAVEVGRLKEEQKQGLNFACIEAIQKIYPEANVHVHLEGQEVAADTTPNPLPQVKNIIAVASGKGGVGKSTVAVNIAAALKKQGAKVGILDADIYGPSIPTMLGLQGQKPEIENLYGQAKIVPVDWDGIPTISIGFVIEPDQAVILRGPRLAGVLVQFIKDCLWPDIDYLIVDLPPGTGDIQLSLVQNVPVTGVVMVTTPQSVAYIDAVKAMNMFRLSNVNVPILGVVENMSWFTPDELPDNKYFIFGKGGGKELAEKGETVLLGQVPITMGVREGGDQGKPVVMQADNIAAKAFMEIAKNLTAQVKKRNEEMEVTHMVEITTS